MVKRHGMNKIAHYRAAMRCVSLAQDSSFALAMAPFESRKASAAEIDPKDTMAIAMRVTICASLAFAVETAIPQRALTITPGPPRSRQIAGSPLESASSTTSPPESCRLGKTKAV